MGLPPQDKAIIRYFITTGAALRRFVRFKASEFDPTLLAKIMTLPFAQFVWIVEFATEDQWAVGQVEARAVIDATASVREIMPLWLLHSRTMRAFRQAKSWRRTARWNGCLETLRHGTCGVHEDGSESAPNANKMTVRPE